VDDLLGVRASAPPLLNTLLLLQEQDRSLIIVSATAVHVRPCARVLTLIMLLEIMSMHLSSGMSPKRGALMFMMQHLESTWQFSAVDSNYQVCSVATSICQCFQHMPLQERSMPLQKSCSRNSAP
jgi:hypothetical protein